MFHVDSDKLIADLRSMFCIVNKTKLLGFHLSLQSFIFLNFNTFAFNLLLPTDLIETFSEEDHIHKYNLVEVLIYFLRDSIEIKCENLINLHILSLLIIQIVIVSFPFLLSGSSSLSFFLLLNSGSGTFLGRVSCVSCSVCLLCSTFLNFLSLWFCWLYFRFVRELNQVLVDGIVSIGLILFVSLEKLIIDLFKMCERICGSSFSLRSIEVFFALRVSSLIRL